MNLSLLLPSALGLLALIGLPYLAHLTLRQPTTRVPFGAMMLINRLMKRLKKRKRLSDYLLLLLRALIIAALVLMAAGPFMTVPDLAPEVGGTGRVVVVFDRSMSMSLFDGGSTLLERGKGLVTQRLRELPEGVEVGLITYDRDVEVLTGELTTDVDRVIGQVDRLEASPMVGDLRGALLAARRLIGEASGEVLLVTDEAGPVMIPSASEEFRRLVETGSAVLPIPVHADPPRNIAVTNAEYTDGMEGGRLTVKVENFGPDLQEVPCAIILPDGQQIELFVEVNANAFATAIATIPREAAGGIGTVRCEDADLALDNTRYFHLPKVGAQRVLLVDGDPGDTPIASEVFFLERALAPWGDQKSGVTPDVASPAGLSVLDSGEYRVVFLANVSDPRPLAPRLRKFVQDGGSLVISVGNNVTAERYNSAFGALLPAPMRKPRALATAGEEPIALKMPDINHPLFRPFRRTGRGSFRRMGAAKVFTLEPYQDSKQVTTLLNYDGGFPALVERRIGAGRVLLWTSSIDLSWTNAPLQAIYMPFMYRMVTYLGASTGVAAQRENGIVGTPVSVELTEQNAEYTLYGPSGERLSSERVGSSLTFLPETPGAYRIEAEEERQVALIAVNVGVEESDVRRSSSVREEEAQFAPDLFSRTIPLERWFLLGAWGLLMLLGVFSTQRAKENP